MVELKLQLGGITANAREDVCYPATFKLPMTAIICR